MTLYNFIFSNKRSTKIVRHVCFWMLWWIVYSVIGAIRRIEFQNYEPWDAIWLSGFEMLLQIPIDMLFCYYIIYVLIPKFLEKDKLVLFFLYWVIGVTVIAIIQHFYGHYVVLNIRASWLGKPVPRQAGLVLSVLSNSLSFNVTAGFATSIRLIKKTIFQKKESVLLMQELDLLRKTRDGEELFSDTFISRIVRGIEKAPGTNGTYLKDVNELVMYLSFECKKKTVPVSAEVNALINYVNIQNAIRSHRCELTVNRNIQRDSNIASFLLIPIADTLMRMDNGQAGTRLLIDIRSKTDELISTITYQTTDAELSELANEELFLLDRKLQILYPQGYRLTKLIKKNSVSVTLQVELGKMVYQ